MRSKTRAKIRHATQAAQKLEELGEIRAANDVRALAQYARHAAGALGGLRKQANKT